MEFSPELYILPAAFLLDFVAGDPEFFFHPVRWMGKAIEIFEPKFRGLCADLSVSGALFSISLITGTWLATFLLLAVAKTVCPLLSICIEILLIYYSISARSLEKSAMDVFRALAKNDLKGAKSKVALIVGRDVENLTKNGVTRAAVETVAENLVDGVISPLFFAAIGGAPLAMAYKMVNTLDSMVGYRNEKYKDFGKTAARIDDAANFIPARISVPVISWAAQILSGRGMFAFKTAVKEGANHLSPNAGFPEAAFAGALGVKLGGPNDYHGHGVLKPYIGACFGKSRIEHIKTACKLMMFSSVLWLFILWLTQFLVVILT